MSRPCRYQFQPGGCRRGSDCAFIHGAPGHGASTDNRTRATHNLTSPTVPQGVCTFYWSKGQCEKDRDCRFRHIRSQAESTSQPSLTPNSDVVLPKDKGLAQVTGTGTDSLSRQPANPLRPGQIQNKLKRFLTDGFHFNKASDVYAFFTLIDSAVSTNPSWTHDDGELFLASLTKENGLRRISEILHWTPVSTSSRLDHERVLSFQQTWLPLLRFLSSNFVVKSTSHQLVNALYSVIVNDFELFSKRLITSMDEMIARQAFVNYLIPSTRSLRGSQILASISGVLFQCLTRFKSALSTHPQITVTVEKLQSWVDVWVQGIMSKPPKFDTVFVGNASARSHAITRLSTNVQTVVDIVNREQARLENPLIPATRSLLCRRILASIPELLFQYDMIANMKILSDAQLRWCLTHFKNAISTHPRVTATVKKLQSWRDAWVQGTTTEPPKFDTVFSNDVSVGRHTIAHLSTNVNTVVDIVDREEVCLERTRREGMQEDSTPELQSSQQEGLVAMLHVEFDGPGALCSTGPRHDNDVAEIQNIRIAPTHEELICEAAPFLPANFYDAPHHLPQESMERLLDIQFRLLREELTASLRTSINLVRNDMSSRSPNTKLATILPKKGGKYRGCVEGDDSVTFNIYTGVEFHSMTPDRRGISVKISFDTPPGQARQSSSGARATFWESLGGKRMMQGGLIALIWSRNNSHDVDIHLGTIASPSREIADSARRRQDRVSSRIIFFDPEVEVRILNVLGHSFAAEADEILLMEAPVMYESIRPFLEGLTTEPEIMPFKEHLVHRPQGYFNNHNIKPPRYSSFPGFKYHLECLFDAGTREVGFTLDMVVDDPNSVEMARNELKNGSRLDGSQVDAVVSALTREVALIQGPPGTGKSYTGLELLRVLVPHARPILIIALTNHALDHLLSGVLDAGITTKIVRLGSRSADQRISEYSITHQDKIWSEADYRQIKAVRAELTRLVKSFAGRLIVSPDIMAYIKIQYPEHHEHICNPPAWISTLILFRSKSDKNGGRKRAQKCGSKTPLGDTTYGRWLRGEDLDFLSTKPGLPAVKPAADGISNIVSDTPNRFNALSTDVSVDGASDDSDSDSDDEESDKKLEMDPDSDSEADWQQSDFSEVEVQNTLTFFNAHSMNSIPKVPDTFRDLETLLAQGSMWTLSKRERLKLDEYWRERTREGIWQRWLEVFENLRRKYKQLLNQGVHQHTLYNIDIIGCTTTGAAKHSALLKGAEPRVLMVEEAGQVMEAHILANLVPSIEHLIMIGDPLQLRPTLNNYKLSVDSRRGSRLYKFNMSLMERLSSAGFPMSRIDIQRRMRPEIAQLIRNTLYPDLEDHDLVKQYPNVRGFARNVFFLTHDNRENDGNKDDSGSKYNTYEVEMIKDMVLYLSKQGCYSQDGDIVVLCAYLGQLARVRDELAQHVAVVLDERDSEALADRELEAEDETEESIVEHIQVSTRVRLRTVDNYQGEEAKVVILSLVRNAGSDDDDAHSFSRTIGFLKSKNRTNVALSRAKHGLFILGNAAQLASKSEMWGTVLEELQCNGNIGQAFPVACYHHPDKINDISQPGQLSRFAPDGGCLLLCDYQLKCGHVCPYKCHPDDPQHVTVVCSQSCRRLCIRGHSCHKQCFVDCRRCMHPVYHVALPCGHVADSVPCFMIENLDNFKCDIIITKQLASCEHTAELPCSIDVSMHRCSRSCAGIMGCCGRTCGSACSDCQAQSQAGETLKIERKSHHRHLCEKLMSCGHECPLPCSKDHACTAMCYEACRQRCAHRSCLTYCSSPCEPCKEVCTWSCSHYTCPMPCGSVCARLPCDKKCEKILQCGHRCPSVCGEDCNIQVCPSCAPPDLKGTVVDLILRLTLDDILTDEVSLDNLLITLPECGHVFTVETLDDHCGLGEYYTKDEHRHWRGLTSLHHAGQRRKPPMCPTCRTAITSPRYGRVFKSANLDVLERNIISHMSGRMNKVQRSWSQIVKTGMECAIAEQAKLVKPGSTKSNGKAKLSRKRNRKAVLNEKELRPVPINAIIPNVKLFGVSPRVVRAWKQIVTDLTKIYKDAADVCDIRSAHTGAWEAAFSILYEREMDKAVSDPEHTIRVARMEVGIPQPRADKRFLVEAIWATLQIRFTLVELARSWIKSVKDLEVSIYPLSERQEWGNYTIFLLESCEKDIGITYEIAEASDSRRQMTKTRLLSLRVQLEKCRFNIEMCKELGLLDGEQRLKFAEEASKGGDNVEHIIAKTTKEHSDTLPADFPGWFEENFLEAAKTIRKHWDNLEQTLKTGTFYEQLSLNKKMAIIKALDFSHVDCFYTCQNGHAFVIAECEGATQVSRCPECGRQIGGQNNMLDESNRGAEEWELANVITGQLIGAIKSHFL